MPEDPYKVNISEWRETIRTDPGRGVKRVTIVKFTIGRLGPFEAEIDKEKYSPTWIKETIRQKKEEIKATQEELSA